ncbi:MAG: late competence development ComFB family protein [Oscillospiraceae bacterium]|nr:late competence development ComFB family protein [Oscillospiraceae bacterium]
MALVNVMEQIVDEKLEQMLQDEDCCKCERCLEDMKAMALNKLPAKYVSTHNGELFTKLLFMMRQNSADINVAVSNAIKVVIEHPSHQKSVEPEMNEAKNAV